MVSKGQMSHFKGWEAGTDQNFRFRVWTCPAPPTPLPNNRIHHSVSKPVADQTSIQEHLVIITRRLSTLVVLRYYSTIYLTTVFLFPTGDSVLIFLFLFVRLLLMLLSLYWCVSVFTSRQLDCWHKWNSSQREFAPKRSWWMGALEGHWPLETDNLEQDIFYHPNTYTQFWEKYNIRPHSEWGWFEI